MPDLTNKQDTARRYVGEALDEAVRDVDDAGELLQHTGIPDVSRLKADLELARAALVKARQTAASLGIRETP